MDIWFIYVGVLCVYCYNMMMLQRSLYGYNLYITYVNNYNDALKFKGKAKKMVYATIESLHKPFL